MSYFLFSTFYIVNKWILFTCTRDDWCRLIPRSSISICFLVELINGESIFIFQSPKHVKPLYLNWNEDMGFGPSDVEQQSGAIITGLNCLSWGEAIIHAVHTIKCKVDISQVVFLIDALSVLQALMNDNLPQLEQALCTIKTLRTVL